MYETYIATMHIVNEAWYWFKLLRLTTVPTLWYKVSLQCSYCDFQDLASKDLLGIRMIMERHMPHLCGSLPFIDQAAHMRIDHFTKKSGDRGRTSQGDKPYNIKYGGTGVKITNDWGNYSMSEARVTIPQPCNNFGMHGVHWRNDRD